MNKLLKYLRPYRVQTVLAPLFKLLEVAMELLVPLVMAAIIDRGVGGGDRAYVLKMSALVAGLGAAGLVFSITAQFFAAQAATGFSADLRAALFRRLQRLAYASLDRLGAPTMIARMTSDSAQVESGLNLTLRLALRSPFVVFGAVAMALVVDTRVGLIFLAVLPLLTAAVIGIMLLTTPRYRAAQRKLDALLGRTRDNLEGARVLRAFAAEEREINAFEEENGALTALQRGTGRIAALSNPLTGAMVNLAIAAVLYSGAVRVDIGVLTQGQVVALVNYMSQILVELVKLANLVVSISKALACAGRIAALLALPTGMPQLEAAQETAEAAGGAAVCFDHVSLTYEGAAAPSLSDISFCAMHGETIGVIGGTGSGKSSLINLIPRFYDATQGRVLVNGKDVRAWDIEALRKRIGVVPQQAGLFRGTLRENLCWRKEDASDEEVYKALEAAQALSFVREKPEGLSMPVSQRGRNFSGGQRQRLTIARALLGEPEILILDDSASALDFATERDLRHALSKLKDMTVFIVSQRAASVRAANRIIVLDDGAVCGIGTHAELMRSCGVYREIYYSQFPDEAGKEAAQA
ncbi:MAG TPA: ABC transporter ATP-binding protein [Candidatus Aphodomonas merdavium]|nr:ABC transporter ATP-binding protein [Candidatus Aphodomonas merdavium]